jgi:TPR repeat protein
VESGISLLKAASAQGYVRASYALGLVLRDTTPDEALHYMSLAADQKYLPALQELLSARDMKLQYGEPDADELRRHMDRLCLNRLLSRHYVISSNLRSVHTSHCWNHLCGRWAYKASNASISTHGGAAMMGPSSFLPHDHGSMYARAATSPATTAPSSVLDTHNNRVSRMKMCSRCCRAKYCSKLCQVYDWRSGRHKVECQFL